MQQATFDDIDTGNGVVKTLQQLQKGDVIQVDAIDDSIRVHRNREYLGTVDIIEAYRESGARANIGLVNGEAWFDYSQLQSFEDQRDRMHQIREVTVIDDRGDNQ